MIVLDASVIVALVVDQDHGVAVRKLLEREPNIALPPLWRYEVGHVLWRYARSGRLADAELLRIVATLTRTFSHREHPVALSETLDSARRYSLSSAYDAAYVALATRLGCPLVTLDREIVRKAPQVARGMEV